MPLVVRILPILLLTTLSLAPALAQNATPEATPLPLCAGDQARLLFIEQELTRVRHALQEAEGKVEGLAARSEYAEKYLDGRTETVNWWLAGIAVLFGLVTLVVIPNKYREAKSLYEKSLNEINTLSRKAKQATDDYQLVLKKLEKAASSKMHRKPADAPITPEDAKDISLAANQDDDLYAKYVAEAFQAQERKDWNSALEAWKNALTIEPNKAQAHFGVGVSYTRLADQTPDNSTRKNFLHNAITQYKTTVSLDDEFIEALNNWGNALRKLAKKEITAVSAERRKLLQEACRKFEEALAIDPSYAKALSNWGKALINLANNKLTKDPRKWYEYLQQASVKFEQGAKTGRDLHLIYKNWSRALLRLATHPDSIKKVADQKKLLEDAKEKMLKALAIKPDYGHYTLARIESRLGNFDEAKECLEKDLATDKLISKNRTCSHLATDPDLQPLREHDPAWWADFMRRACPEGVEAPDSPSTPDSPDSPEEPTDE